MNKPLLSICIPTYNRCEYLKKSLDSIVSQDGFNEEVEIVISDNHSCDDTLIISKQYAKEYNNIKYFRNDENIGDKNHPLSLKRASGILRKISNDTIIYRSGALKYMLDLVRSNLNEKPVVFFLSSGTKNKEIFECDSIDSFIKYTSYFVTWIKSISFWEEDCHDMVIYEEDQVTRIPHVKFLLYCLNKRKKSVISDKEIMEIQYVTKKNLSYGLYKVFYINFLEILQNYYDNGLISNETIYIVKRDLLLKFFTYWLVEIWWKPNDYLLDKEDLEELLEKSYSDEQYYRDYKMIVKYNKVKRIVFYPFEKMRDIFHE